MDKIHIKDLEIFAKHGVFPEENTLGQKFVLSATLYTDTRIAGVTDELAESIHYGEVSERITEFVQGHTFKLLETVVEALAANLLMNVPGLKGVGLEIKKPWAPVGLPLDTVSVEIERWWHTAYIALGSNMGNKAAFLKQAVESLADTSGCVVEQVSDLIITEPYGGVEQDNFLNGVLKLRTLLTPEELLAQLHRIEAEANRERVLRWGPRTLDLDIIFYDDLVLDTAELHIPHIDMHNRDFVLQPMCQLSPWLRHPVLNRTMLQLYNELNK